jgi:hypothetical protein
VGRRVKEAYVLGKDTWFGAEFAIAVKMHEGPEAPDGSPAPSEDVALRWVDDAVTLAEARASEQGWSSISWRQLVERVLAVDD